MPKVTITVEDKEDGQVEIKAAFDPPTQRDDTHTAAQLMGLRLCSEIQDMLSDQDKIPVEINGQEVKNAG